MNNPSPTSRFRSLCCRIAIAITSIFLSDSFFAQNVQVDRARLLQSQIQPQTQLVPTGSPSGVENGQAAASPNDADLGEQQILKQTEQYRAFTDRKSTRLNSSHVS